MVNQARHSFVLIGVVAVPLLTACGTSDGANPTRGGTGAGGTASHGASSTGSSNASSQSTGTGSGGSPGKVTSGCNATDMSGIAHPFGSHGFAYAAGSILPTGDRAALDDATS